MSWRMKVVAVATVAVAVAALAGFAVKAPELAAAAGSIHATAAEREWAGSVTASWQERSVGATGGWATAVWIDSLQPVAAADEGFASDGARTALAAGVTGLGGAAAAVAPAPPVSPAPATTIVAGVTGSATAAVKPLAAALRHGVEIKALVAAARVSLEQVRVEVVARAQTVLDTETPDADAPSRDALAAALAAPALAAPSPDEGGPSRQTASALGALLSAARAAQASQAAAAALAASQAGSSGGGSGGNGSSGDSGSRYPTPTAEQLAAAAANQAAVNQQMVDAINNWVSQQPPVLSCAETPSCRGY